MNYVLVILLVIIAPLLLALYKKYRKYKEYFLSFQQTYTGKTLQIKEQQEEIIYLKNSIEALRGELEAVSLNKNKTGLNELENLLEHKINLLSEKKQILNKILKSEEIKKILDITFKLNDLKNFTLNSEIKIEQHLKKEEFKSCFGTPYFNKEFDLKKIYLNIFLPYEEQKDKIYYFTEVMPEFIMNDYKTVFLMRENCFLTVENSFFTAEFKEYLQKNSYIIRGKEIDITSYDNGFCYTACGLKIKTKKETLGRRRISFYEKDVVLMSYES